MTVYIKTINNNGVESWEESPIFKKDIGVANGVAGVDSNGLVPSKNTPKTQKSSGTLTRSSADVTGNFVVSGLGFGPSIVHVITSNDQNSANRSMGWSDGMVNASISGAGSNLTSCIDVVAGGNGHVATILLDPDGFTVSWNKVGDGLNLTVKYLAIK